MDLGAEVKRLSDGVGPSVTIDTTGIISIATAALDFTASLGRLVIVGVPSQTAELQLNLGQLMAVSL
jgi:Zn-dependent alcohol dehydrogenase